MPKKGYIPTEEHKRKLSEAAKGKTPSKGKHWKLSEENKRHISEARKGKYLSEETRRHLSEALKGRLSPMKGKHPSEETKRKNSEAHKGKIPWDKGKYLSEETKKKIGKAMKGKLAKDNNPNWKGGISFEPYTTDWTDDLKEAIRKRDGYVCQICGTHQDELKGFHKKLDIHHIDYDKNNLNPNNLISLCKSCHSKTNFNRKYWINFFQGGEK